MTMVEQHCKWSEIASEIKKVSQNDRSGKQCRERWMYHLNPAINRNEWTLQE